MGNQPLGYINPAIYALAQGAAAADDFHDITRVTTDSPAPTWLPSNTRIRLGYRMGHTERGQFGPRPGECRIQ
jgi:hypothetical protein